MTEEQLQLLRAARLSGRDENDPEVVAARAAAAADAEVLAWLEEERRTDLAMQQGLRDVDPPPELESALLTAMRAARGHAEPPADLRETVLHAVRLPVAPPTVVRGDFTRRKWLGWSLAAAASIVASGAWWWRENHAFSMRRLSEQLAAITKKGVTLSLMSMDKDAVVNWLREHQAPRADALPGKLDALGRKGCHLYEIEGHAVGLECLLLPGMKELHLFCTPARGLTDPPADGLAAEVRPFADRTLATWTRGAQTMLLFCTEPPEEIRALLG